MSTFYSSGVAIGFYERKVFQPINKTSDKKLTNMKKGKQKIEII